MHTDTILYQKLQISHNILNCDTVYFNLTTYTKTNKISEEQVVTTPCFWPQGTSDSQGRLAVTPGKPDADNLKQSAAFVTNSN